MVFLIWQGAPNTNDSRKVHTVQQRKEISHTMRGDPTVGWHSTVRIPIIGIVLVCVSLLAGWGCATKTPVIRPQCPSLNAGDYYFPMRALDPSRPKIDDFLRGWYSRYLRAMLEPSLSCGARPDGFAYRFLWLRSFHHPIAMRIEKSGSSVTLSAVELDGTGGNAPGGIVKSVQRELSSAEQDEFLAKLARVDFWRLRKNEERFGLDGAQWVLEGAENGQYRVVERWSPPPGAYRDVCLLLLQFTGITIGPLDFY